MLKFALYYDLLMAKCIPLLHLIYQAISYKYFWIIVQLLFLSLGLRLVLKNEARWRHAHLFFSDKTRQEKNNAIVEHIFTPKIRTTTMKHHLF